MLPLDDFWAELGVLSIIPAKFPRRSLSPITKYGSHALNVTLSVGAVPVTVQLTVQFALAGGIVIPIVDGPVGIPSVQLTKDPVDHGLGRPAAARLVIKASVTVFRLFGVWT